MAATTRPGGREQTDVLVVGCGPAGSTLAWALAKRGIDALVLERTAFPREKVCGDYVDPRGVKVLEAMGCLQALERSGSVPIAHASTYVDWERQYSGPIPFYGWSDGYPAHGYTWSRAQLDTAMRDAAVRAGAIVHEDTSVREVASSADGVEVIAERRGTTARYSSRLIVGADGVNSVVAESQGHSVTDLRRMSVAQRAYAFEPHSTSDLAEAAFFYDEQSFPGYGWIFPSHGGRLNIGIGLLAEARARAGVHVPALFERFIEHLRRHHPLGAAIQLDSKAIGGVVKMYGAAGRNHFDGGLLIGDAGCFVDPMTGEGITPGMESALLAAPVLSAALATGDLRASSLAAYERAFRAYFDPSMAFLDFCATLLRNRHLARPWLQLLARAYQVAETDERFARICGSYFGALEVRPLNVLAHMLMGAFEEGLLIWPRAFSRKKGAQRVHPETTPAHMLAWHTALLHSMVSDGRWHLAWMLELQRQWSRALAAAAMADGDPRTKLQLPA